MSNHYKSIARRTNPQQIALFPLNGTVLLPGCDLPLNVFEPRYLNMVDDALKADRLIGMIQMDEQQALYEIGSLGRITQFSETDDGCYLVVLRGLKRFKFAGLVDCTTPYQQAEVDFTPFAEDVQCHIGKALPAALMGRSADDRSTLVLAMKNFARSLGVQVDWDGLEDIPLPRLVDQAAMISPFKSSDKQSLLECSDYDMRRRLLIGLMNLYANSDKGQDNPPM